MGRIVNVRAACAPAVRGVRGKGAVAAPLVVVGDWMAKGGHSRISLAVVAGMLLGRSRSRSRARELLWFLMVLPLLLSGCASMGGVHQGQSVSHHFGYVRVIQGAKDTSDAVTSSSVSTLGVWVAPSGGRGGQSAGLGYLHSQSMFIPLDCRLVLNTGSQVQLDDVIAALKDLDLNKDQICITHPHTGGTGSLVSRLP